MQNEKIRVAELTLQRTLDWVSRFDTRVAFTAGINLAMLGVLVTASSVVQVWSWYNIETFILAAFFLCLSLFFIYRSQFPNTNSQNDSLIYFGTISKLTSEKYLNNIKSMRDEDYLEDICAQVHTNSQILSLKFMHLKASLVSISLSIIPWLLAIYFSNLYIK